MIYLFQNLVAMSYDLQPTFEAHSAILKAYMSDDLQQQKLYEVIDLFVATYMADNKVLFCGNGGSAADSEHLAGELAGRFMKERPPLFAEALHVNAASLTAISNDYSFESAFARILESKAKPGDLLYLMSTSGQSKNILVTAKRAKALGCKLISVTGQNATPLAELSDLHIAIPSAVTPRVQEIMMLIGHIICEQVETRLFPDL